MQCHTIFTTLFVTFPSFSLSFRFYLFWGYFHSHVRHFRRRAVRYCVATLRTAETHKYITRNEPTKGAPCSTHSHHSLVARPNLAFRDNLLPFTDAAVAVYHISTTYQFNRLIGINAFAFNGHQFTILWIKRLRKIAQFTRRTNFGQCYLNNTNANANLTGTVWKCSGASVRRRRGKLQM